jgi:hypothetical protein
MATKRGLKSKLVAGAVAIAAGLASQAALAGAGGLRAHEVVRGNHTDIYNVTFNGGSRAAVAIYGDGDTDLDLYVYDQNGNLICRATGRGDAEACRWTPRWTGPFRIEVRNLGGMSNRYRLATN